MNSIPPVQTGLSPRHGYIPTTLVHSSCEMLPQIPRSEALNSNINNRSKDRPFRYNPFGIWTDYKIRNIR